jgi:hypothetical protein
MWPISLLQAKGPVFGELLIDRPLPIVTATGAPRSWGNCEASVGTVGVMGRQHDCLQPSGHTADRPDKSFPVDPLCGSA